MRRPAAWVVLALLAGGCATAAPEGPGTATTPPARPGAAPAATAAPRPPSPREQLAARHRAEAERLERAGDLRRALDHWKIARLVNKDDAVAREGQTRLEGRIESAVAQRIQEGRAALQRSSHVEARRRFLAALALDPFNRAAFEALQNDVREVESINHTVRAGDTLSTLAQRYYGDRSRSEVIWETNQLPPSPRLVAGTTLKIPEIPGLPFLRAEPRREPLPPLAAPAPAPGATPGPPAPSGSPGRSEPVRDEPPEVNPLLADAREALERKEYPAALAGLDRLLAGTPSDREGQDLRKIALYQYGKAQFDQRQYEESYRTLTQLAKIQPGYEDSPRLLQQSRARLVDKHYSEGIKLYRDEKLKEAIREWQVVLEFEPSHANAKKNIEQAERLLRGLEQRRKK